jgi:ligand-binding sensor domain-containing protein
MDNQDIHHTSISSVQRVFDFLKVPGLGLYLATQSGLILMDNNNKEIKSYVHDPQNPGSISDNVVWTIYRDKKNRIWTGSTGKSGGLNLFNPLTETFTLYQPDPKNSKRDGYNSIYRIYEDRQANLWVGTPLGIGKMNDKGEFTKYLPFPEDTVVYGRNFVMCILEDSRQNLWVGTESGGGLHILDRKTGKFAHYLNHRRVYQLFEDNDGKFWAGAEDGLYFYNAGLDSFTVFKDPSTGNSFSAWGIQEDANKNLWVSSAGGLYKINHDRLGLSRFGKRFGINSARFSGLGIYEADDGQFFIAIGGGYYALYPVGKQHVAWRKRNFTYR